MKLLHQDATPRDLGLLRLWVFGIWICKIILDPLHRLAILPATIFDPPGPLRLIPARAWEYVLTPAFLTSFKVALLVSLLLVFLGLFTRTSAVISAILLVLHQGLTRGFGHINHAELCLLYAAIILALFPCGDALALFSRKADPRRPHLYSVPLVAIAAVISLTYFFIGTYRIVHGGLAIFTSDSLSYYIIEQTSRNSYYSWEFGRLLLDQPLPPWVLRLAFLIGTVNEVLAPLCLVSRRFRLVFLTLIVPFHVIIFFFMNILFLENLLMLIVFVDSSRWLSPVSIQRSSSVATAAG